MSQLARNLTSLRERLGLTVPATIARETAELDEASQQLVLALVRSLRGNRPTPQS